MDYINRINSIETIRNEIMEDAKIINNNLYLCIKSKNEFYKLTERFNIDATKKILGSPSLHGESYKACLSENETCIVVKQVPLDEPYPDNIYDTESRSKALWNELIISKICNILVEENICPNLPINYGHYICDSCVFSNKKNNDCILSISELCDLGDGNEFFKDHYEGISSEYSYEEVLSYILFQVYIALYSLQKYFNITHHDLHAGNILFKRTLNSKDKYVVYVIDGNNYYVKNLGFIVILWDFGFAMSPNKLLNVKLKKYYVNLKSINEKNIVEDWIQIPRLTVDYQRITKNIYERLNHEITESIYSLFMNTFNGFVNGVVINNILKYYRKYYSKRHEFEHKFSVDKFLKLNNEIKDLMKVNKFKDEVKHLKNDTLMRLQYINENNLIDVEFPHYNSYFDIK